MSELINLLAFVPSLSSLNQMPHHTSVRVAIIAMLKAMHDIFISVLSLLFAELGKLVVAVSQSAIIDVELLKVLDVPGRSGD